MCSEGIYERYVNFYTDFAFKKLFGTEVNKDLLISFLNALLHGREEIREITYLNTEHLGTQEYDSSSSSKTAASITLPLPFASKPRVASGITV